MQSQRDQNFKDYKRAEEKALQIVAEMQSVNAKSTDIELALLVAVFVLHKDSLPAIQIGSIVNAHVQQLIPFYQALQQPPEE